MKTFNKTDLPISINYNGKIYNRNSDISFTMNDNEPNINAINAQLKKEKRLGVMVCVLSKNLKGKPDIHGKPYKPTKWIFSTCPKSF